MQVHGLQALPLYLLLQEELWETGWVYRSSRAVSEVLGQRLSWP